MVWWSGASKLLVVSDFATASFSVSCSGFGEAGFEALGLVASVLQMPDSGGIRYTIRMLESTSAKPDAGKEVGSSTPFPADATINLFY